MYGVVQFSVWSRLRQMFFIAGAYNVFCSRDLCLLFSLVLDNLDRISTLTFSLLGMCWTHTRSKADCMTLRTR